MYTPFPRSPEHRLGGAMNRLAIYASFLGALCVALVLMKLSERWIDQYIENQIQDRLKDYEKLKQLQQLGDRWADLYIETEVQKRVQNFEKLSDVKKHAENISSRLENAITLAWQVNSKDDRQLMSRRLNILMRELNQFLCDLKDAITSTGGWCSRNFQTGHVTDEPLAKVVATMLQGQKVASFGEGPGQYKKLLLASGLVKTYDAFDGSPFIENATNGSVQFLDLTIPHYGLSIYDWIISLEVAEHIPAQYEDIFLSNIIRHSKRGVIMSWAVIGQGGMGHVNTRSMEYVEEKMKGLCFEKDEKVSKELKEKASVQWLKNNINLYLRNNSCAISLSDA